MKDAETIYKKLKKSHTHYEEETHCILILQVMMDEQRGRISSFCSEVHICEMTFYTWLRNHSLFMECYSLGKMLAREAWEEQGYILREYTSPPGTISHMFDHWRMIGWSRFGISKNARIKLNLSPNGNPAQHYKELLKQAADGDFTASEIKQLMEAINVGLNTHQVFKLQEEIDQLKSDLETMQKNTDAHNSGTTKGIA